MWLAENTGCKKSQKIRHQGTIAQLLSGCIFATKACIESRKKLVKQQYITTRPHNMVNLGPLMAEIGLQVWGTPADFNGFSVLASLLQRRRSPEANQALHDVGSVVLVFAGGASVHPIYRSNVP